MKKTIKTMRGKSIDFEKLILQNENTRAVGNMNVNAVGEEIKDTFNKSVSRDRRNSNKYRRQIGKKVFDMPVFDSKYDAEKSTISFAQNYISNVKEIDQIDGINEITIKPENLSIPKPVELTPEILLQDINKAKASSTTISTEDTIPSDDIKKEEEERLQVVKNKSSKGGGLAKAIAKAKEVKQQPIKSPREQLRSDNGVKKI